MWKNLNFSKKVWLLVSVFILFAVTTGLGYHVMSNKIRTIGIESASTEMLDGYKNELKDIVDVMAVSLASATKGMSNEKDIYEAYSTIARDPRFLEDGSGYFFIYKTGGDVFMHAAKQSLEGKNLFNFKDSGGTKLIQDLESAAKSGGGYVEYLWDKPKKGIQPKLAFSKMIPNSPYWIGTGVYIDDVKEKEAAILAQMDEYSQSFLLMLYGVLAAIFFLVIMPLTLYMIKSMVVPVTNLTNIASEYSRGKLGGEFEGTDRKDEIGSLSRAVQRLGRSTQIVMEKLQESNK